MKKRIYSKDLKAIVKDMDEEQKYYTEGVAYWINKGDDVIYRWWHVGSESEWTMSAKACATIVAYFAIKMQNESHKADKLFNDVADALNTYPSCVERIMDYVKASDYENGKKQYYGHYLYFDSLTNRFEAVRQPY